MEIVFHSADDIVAVCGDSPKKCDPVPLREEDTIIYEADLRKLCAHVAAALHLEASQRPTPELDRTWNLGAFVPRAGAQLLVYLGLPSSREDFRRIIMELVLGRHPPFLVLTPTAHHSETATIELIRANDVLYLALEEILGLSDDGKLVASIDLADIVADGRSRLPNRRESAVSAETYEFKKQGRQWRVVYQDEDEAFFIQDVKGARLLNALLHEPGRRFSHQELEVAAGDAPPTLGATVAFEDELNLYGLTDTGEVYDERALHDFRDRLQDLSKELEMATRDNDRARMDRLTEEKEQLLDILNSKRDKRGRPRRSGGPDKQCYNRVSNALNRAIAKIDKACPRFAEHLRNCLERGDSLSYRPSKSIPWTF